MGGGRCRTKGKRDKEEMGIFHGDWLVEGTVRGREAEKRNEDLVSIMGGEGCRTKGNRGKPLRNKLVWVFIKGGLVEGEGRGRGAERGGLG